MKTLNKAISALKEGSFVLIHDSDGRENETDLVVAAEHITPSHIARMRNDGGGLICVSVGKMLAQKLGLFFLQELYAKASKDFPLLAELKADDIPYDEKSSFSLAINHRKTFTGITDEDRSLTIRELAYIAAAGPSPETFGLNFRTPGHVHLLISSGLDRREGHTELSEALLTLAGLTPLAVICEMMDDVTHKALSQEKVRAYAKENGYMVLEADDIKTAWRSR